MRRFLHINFQKNLRICGNKSPGTITFLQETHIFENYIPIIFKPSPLLLTDTPPKTNKLHGLDHLRALAISMVFLFHYPESEVFGTNYKFVSFGWTGVDLFFVLSGYLISAQLFRAIKKDGRVPLKDFYIKRFFRIFPAYYVVIAIYFLIPGFAENARNPPPVWRFLSFTQNIGLEGGKFSHAWSLSVEEQFYLFFPLILALIIYIGSFKKILFSGIILLFSCTFLFRLYLWNNYQQPLLNAGSGSFTFWIKWIYYFTLSRLDGLLTGIAIAAIIEFVPSAWQKINRHGNLLLLSGILVLVAGYFLTIERISFNGTIYGFSVISIAYGLMVMAAVCPTCILYKFSTVLTSSLATLSYSIYLIHKGIIHICHVQLEKMDADITTWWVLLLCAAASIAAAFVLRYVVEKPFLKLRDKVLSRKV